MLAERGHCHLTDQHFEKESSGNRAALVLSLQMQNDKGKEKDSMVLLYLDFV